MNPVVLFLFVLGYFGILIAISKWAEKGSDHNSFFTANQQSPWYLVAFGMIGATLSGVTFVSIPGTIANKSFYYSQFIIGNVVGYVLIAYILIPLYYRMKLVSIYTYLENRFGVYSYRSGSLLFLLSQSFGAALRLLLAAKVLQVIFGDKVGIHLFVTSSIILLLIWLYTKQVGIKAIVYTDTLQTFFMLSAVIVTIIVISNRLDMPFEGFIDYAKEKNYFHWFDWNPNNGTFFWKQFISGILIAVSMMGLDQNMMQKSLTCKNVKDAQKNVLTFSVSAGVAQILFLFLGVALYVYADKSGISLPMNASFEVDTDQVFPLLAVNNLGAFVAISFILGLSAAAFSSADSSMTSLTTAICYDFLDFKNKKPEDQNRIRKMVHILVAFGLFLIMIGFSFAKGSVFSLIFTAAGYTYGPLLGLFLIGMFTKIQLNDSVVPFTALFSPVTTYFISAYLTNYHDFDLSFAVILLNAILFMVATILLSIVFEKEKA